MHHEPLTINPCDLYHTMLLIRRFEEKVDELFTKGVIYGTTHLSAGQEAVAVGACAAIRPSDYLTSNHRGHGHFLAKGGDPRRIMAELFGRETGYSKGRGGSQHMACPEIGFLGSNGITGGGIPIATGAALALKRQERDAVVLCFFGDGAVNQGVFHESMNLAALWKLPVIYICENNRYAMSTPFEATSPVPHVADRAKAYSIPSMTIDGNEVLTVKNAVSKAVESARCGYGPWLIECETYRYYGHSKSDQRSYRTQEEEAEWKARDPLLLYHHELLTQDQATSEQFSALEERVDEEIEECVRFAQESPYPACS